jgi:hypothetical protein
LISTPHLDLPAWINLKSFIKSYFVVILLLKFHIMPKSYSAFNYDDLKDLGLKVINDTLFTGVDISPIEPSDFLKILLSKNMKRRMHSEKAKSEFIIAPILSELEDRNAGRFAFYSGYKFDVDKKQGLTGFCDFIFSREAQALRIESPVFCVVESKNENIEAGIPQCIAEMYASKIFNEKQGKPIPILYGAVTFGLEWKFLQLKDNLATVDYSVFYLNQLPQILGIMQYLVDNA